MSYETDYAVAKALGYEIVPANKAYCGTFTTGVKYLFTHDGKLWRDAQATAHDAQGYNEFSPSTDADDAIAALEAMADVKQCAFWCGRNLNRRYEATLVISIECMVKEEGETLPKAICQAILRAAK